MPRGGKRPGAGAPRGNLNALTTGNHSPRLRFAFGMLMAMPMPEAKEVMRQAWHAGVWHPKARVKPGTAAFNDVIAWLYNYFIDCLHNASIKSNQTNQTPEATPPPPNQTPASAAEIPANSKDNQTHADCEL